MNCALFMGKNAVNGADFAIDWSDNWDHVKVFKHLINLAIRRHDY